MALVSTQPLSKGGRCVGLATLLLICRMSINYGNLNFWDLKNLPYPVLYILHVMSEFETASLNKQLLISSFSRQMFCCFLELPESWNENFLYWITTPTFPSSYLLEKSCHIVQLCVAPPVDTTSSIKRECLHLS